MKRAFAVSIAIQRRLRIITDVGKRRLDVMEKVGAKLGHFGEAALLLGNQTVEGGRKIVEFGDFLIGRKKLSARLGDVKGRLGELRDGFCDSLRDQEDGVEDDENTEELKEPNDGNGIPDKVVVI